MQDVPQACINIFAVHLCGYMQKDYLKYKLMWFKYLFHKMELFRILAALIIVGLDEVCHREHTENVSST